MQPQVSKATHPTQPRSRGRRPRLVGGHARAALLIAILSSCERSSMSDGLTETQDCSACHGSRINAAPPRSVNGSTNTNDIGVGAHQVHLVAGHVAAPIACTECHLIPTDLLSHPALQSRPAIVVFGPSATRYSLTPSWDRGTATCADTYCHGSRLSGAASRQLPIWTTVDGRQRSCSSCHGNPPAGDHPSSSACYLCHGDVVSADGTITNFSRHIDGNVDFSVVPDAGVLAAGGAGASSADVTATGGGS